MALVPLVSFGVSWCLLDVSSCLPAVSHASRETNFQNSKPNLSRKHRFSRVEKWPTTPITLIAGKIPFRSSVPVVFRGAEEFPSDAEPPVKVEQLLQVNDQRGRRLPNPHLLWCQPVNSLDPGAGSPVFVLYASAKLPRLGFRRNRM